eukprot:11943939-Alexandrium_andersonii.AAC.1
MSALTSVCKGANDITTARIACAQLLTQPMLRTASVQDCTCALTPFATLAHVPDRTRWQCKALARQR